MKQPMFILLTVSMVFTWGGCCKKQHSSLQTLENKSSPAQAGPPVFIYKTRADYSKHVPVTLSDDKKKIISYPDRKDLYREGGFSYPTPLSGGYLLDNRGISQNTAFLILTYEEYSQLPKTPPANELITQILDNDPFTELYYCGIRYQYKDLVAELNSAIEKKDFSKFRKDK